MMQRFRGTWPALVTPSTAEGTANVKVLDELVDYLLDKKVDGFYLCGSTGEGLFQSVDERKLVTETVLQRVNGRVPAIVHVGCVATRDAVELASHAQQVGAAGVSSVLPPVARTEASTLLHYESVAAAAPKLPFFPYLFGGQTDAVTLMRELLNRIPNMAGSKYTGPNMYELRHLVELGGSGWTIFSGMDEQCIFAAMFGAPANIGSTLNCMPGVYRALRSSYERGDLAQAQELQLRANRVTRVLHSFGFSGALCEVMRMLGFECGEPRLPNLPLLPERREAFRKELNAVDFAELAGM